MAEAIVFSLSLPNKRVVTVAIVTQPKPRIERNDGAAIQTESVQLRSASVASRGRYLLSSIKAKER
jgi:hypothetical protein